MDPIIENEYELDYLAYMQLYDQYANLVRKPRSQATMPGKIDHNDKPLDFSFLELQECVNLRKERPRPGGKRKPIEKDEDEEDTKKNDLNGLPGDQKVEGVDQKDGKKDPQTVKNNSIPLVQNILENYSVSLNAAKNGVMGGRKQEEGGEQASRKKEVVLHVNAILLNNNYLRDLNGLHETLCNYVLYEPHRLQWINLSYNYLVKIDKEILNFQALKTLQLHGNFIKELEEVRKLNLLPELQNLTLNGNPIEEIKGYRLYVLGMMFQEAETLRRLDSVIISKNEFDAVLVWNQKLLLQYRVLEKPGKGYDEKLKDQQLFMKHMKRLKPKSPIRKPPAKEEEENGGATK